MDLSVLEKAVRDELGEYLPDARVASYPGCLFVEVVRSGEALSGMLSNLPTDAEWFPDRLRDKDQMRSWAKILVNYLWREVGRQAERLRG